jgi:hypothetical protein
MLWFFCTVNDLAALIGGHLIQEEVSASRLWNGGRFVPPG